MNYEMMRNLHILAFTILLHMASIGQQDDPILFTIDDEGVPTSEFLYIYNKNNVGNASYNKSSVREYLDLYKNFKLKVHHARALKMDTIQRLNQELAGYREQLAATYLNDNSVMGRLASEAYERMQKEAEVSHILIAIPKQSANTDTTKAYTQAMEVYNTLQADQMSFEETARLRSHDGKNKNMGGYIGYIKAILPRGYYALESAIYSLTPGSISKPVRSPRGYHIVKLHKFRDAKPEVEIAHILIKKKTTGNDSGEAQRKIADIHNRITRGVPFEEIASKESQDETTSRKGGRIGYIKVGEYDEVFEQAAYNLTSDGQISEPIETRVGFHVLKRLGVKERLSFNDARRRIETELRRTERETMAREAMINRIKKEENLSVNTSNKSRLFGQIDQSIFTYKWTKPAELENEVLFQFGNNTAYTSNDFIQYLLENPKDRIRLKRQPKNAALETLFNKYLGEACLEIEKARLEEKYPDFASLMREYEEGILLFEITKENVWDRASADTIGLRKYFNAHRGDYMFPERIECTTFTIADSDPKKAKKIVKQIKKKSDSELLKAYPNMPQENETIEQNPENKDKFAWKEGKVSELKPLGKSGKAFRVSKTKKVFPPRPKALDECRGYVIAHYQEALEKSWLEELNKKYTIKENQSAVNKIIK